MSKKKDNSRIIGLKVRNVKRLLAVDFNPNPEEPIIGIGGKNASGKTSLLDSIQYALAGSKNIPDDAVRQGAKKGEIEIELDDYIVKRIITKKGTRLEIKGKDGKIYASPQTLLDEMTGKLTFDPLKFQRLSETSTGRKEQAEILKNLVGLNLSGLEDKRKAIFNRRSDINRELKSVQARIDSMTYHPGIPKDELSIRDLSNELSDAIQQNQKNYTIRQDIAKYKQHIQDLETKIESLNEELNRTRAKLIQQQDQVDNLEDVDEDSIREQIETAESTNQKIRNNKQRDALLQQQTSFQDQADNLTEEINQLDQDKQKLLSEAKLPVTGLTFNDDQVFFNNIPFENCSSAEQLKLSVAMGIAMNPKLRIMLIRDGSLLDEESRKTLKLMAEQNDCQCWVEFVGSDEECSIVIEDGSVLEIKE